jgi:hypothetical protein
MGPRCLDLPIARTDFDSSFEFDRAKFYCIWKLKKSTHSSGTSIYIVIQEITHTHREQLHVGTFIFFTQLFQLAFFKVLYARYDRLTRKENAIKSDIHFALQKWPSKMWKPIYRHIKQTKTYMQVNKKKRALNISC